MEEVWKEVSGRFARHITGGPLYEVSNLGNIRKLHYDEAGQVTSYLPLRMRIDKYTGHVMVNMYVEGHESVLAHRVYKVVADAFLDNPNNYHSVDHLDGDKLNNAVDNLQWNTNRRGKNRIIIRAVRQYSKDGKLIGEFASVHEAAKATGFSSAGIRACCDKLAGHRTSKGYVWRYVDADEIVKGDLSETISKQKSRMSRVRQYTLSGEFVKEYANAKVAAEAVFGYAAGIHNVCRRESNSSAGFLWRYPEDDEFEESNCLNEI